MEIFVENFYEIVYGLQIAQIVIININTYTKIKARIATINDFKVAKLKMTDVKKQHRTDLNDKFSLPPQSSYVWHPSQ